MGRTLSVLILVAWWLTLETPTAVAGTYDVLSCGAAPGGAVGSAWTTSNTAPAALDTGPVCPPAGDEFGGLRAVDRFDATIAPNGSAAGWAFSAPSGTTIVRWRYDRYLGKYLDNDWHVYVRLGDGTEVDTCEIPVNASSCGVGFPGYGAPSAHRDLAGLSTDSLAIGVKCDAPPGVDCATGGSIHRVWATLYASRVTLEENGLPSLGAGSGSLVDPDRWHRGIEQISFSASDPVGIRETRAYAGQTIAASVTRQCDYTATVPCTSPAGEVEHAVDTRSLPDGVHELRAAAIDAAGNERSGSPVSLRVDNNAPSFGITARLAGPASPGVDVSWEGVDGTGSGVASYDIAVSTDGGPWQPWLTGTAATGARFTGEAGRRYRFRGSALDASGLRSAESASDEVSPAPPPASPTPDAPAPAPPPAADQGPSPAPGGEPSPTSRSVPWLAVRALRRSAFGLVVAGRIDSRARGRVRLLLTDRRGRRVGRAVLRIRRGRFRGLVPVRAAAPRPAWLTLRYGGDPMHLPRSLRLRPPRG